MKFFRTDKPLATSWSLVSPSVDLLKQNLWPTIYLSFLPALVLTAGLVVMQSGQTANVPDREMAGRIILILAAVWAIVTYPAFTYLQARAIHGDRPTVMESFRKGLPRLLPLILMSLLAGLLIVLGLIALIIPGLILIRGFMLAPYYVVDKGMGPVEALKQSYKDSTPVSAFIWGVIGVELAFALVGGLFAAIPVIGQLIALAFSYPYIFAPALRYGEIVDNLAVHPKV